MLCECKVSLRTRVFSYWLIDDPIDWSSVPGAINDRFRTQIASLLVAGACRLYIHESCDTSGAEVLNRLKQRFPAAASQFELLVVKAECTCKFDSDQIQVSTHCNRGKNENN